MERNVRLESKLLSRKYPMEHHKRIELFSSGWKPEVIPIYE